MTVATSTRPVVLIAVPENHSLATALEAHEYAAIEVHIGGLAIACARDLQPDVILVGAELPDMSGIDACRLLQSDLRIGHGVPIVILASDPPTSEERVAALRAGAWDVLPHSGDTEELSLKLQTYVQAKRNIDVALAGGLVKPTSGVCSRPALARRARELGALMARERGALACVVFDLETGPGGPYAGTLVVRTVRVCDTVGAWSPTEIALLAPATGHPGAVKLAQRVATALGMATDTGQLAPGSTLRAGYDAVGNLTYSPLDPFELLSRAATAVRSGTPDPSVPWVRRFDADTAEGRDADLLPYTATPGLVSEKKRRTSS
jgi:DNA-binding response OmpR family regulator